MSLISGASQSATCNAASKENKFSITLAFYFARAKVFFKLYKVLLVNCNICIPTILKSHLAHSRKKKSVLNDLDFRIFISKPSQDQIVLMLSFYQSSLQVLITVLHPCENIKIEIVFVSKSRLFLLKKEHSFISM